MEKLKDKVLACLTLRNCENPYSNLLQIACCGINEASCDSINFNKPEMILKSITVLLFNNRRIIDC
jgi:hypothetical protein